MLHTTRWSLVLAARGESVQARAALAQLCATYRGPVLEYARRHARTLSEAEDLTQAFFVDFLEHAAHAAADPTRGSFRAFLFTSLRRFIGHVRKHDQALKRGGGVVVEAYSSDRLAALPDADALAPEQAFERACALAVLDRASERLRREAEAAGKGAMFHRLREFLFEPPDADAYRRLGSELGLRSNTLAVTVHRLRDRLRELVRDELAHTVSSEGELHQELRAMRDALARN